MRRLSGLPNVINELAWSPDGRWLAAGLGDKNGIRLYRAGDFVPAGEDKVYGGEVYGLDFDRQGRLVATSVDGALRLYRIGEGSLTRLAKEAAPGGRQPFGARFSPDGQSIAVGFSDSLQVNVLAADTLDFHFAADVSGLPADRSLNTVAWSVDGSTLYAGGTANIPGSSTFSVRAWTQGGRGAYRELEAAGSTLGDLRPLADGGLAFGSGDPAWGVFDATGQRRRFVAPAIPDFPAGGRGFLLAPDSLTVGFAYDQKRQFLARFSLGERHLLTGSDASLQLPTLSAPGLDVQGWINTTAPTLNGQALALQQYETAHSLALAPDGQGFVLGADWTLRRFDPTGKVVWQKPVPGVVWAVNVSQDGRFAVAAYGDGTIRWHRWSDGQEVLAFFPHADKQRWVLWTPSGYYDASPGGEDLIGWHLNRGKDNAAEFFPASRFRSQFYRPDVISRILDTLDEGEALKQANAAAGRRAEARPVAIQNVLPPVVEIASPGDGATVSSQSVTIRYSTRTAGDAPVTGIKVRVNGQAVSVAEVRGAKSLGGGLQELSVAIPPQDSEVQVFAENKNGVSTPATLRLKWAGASPAREAALFKPRLYVLAVGVSKYANASFNLGLAAKDARDFAAVLQAQKGRLYADVQVRLLTDAQATKDEVLDGLDWLRREVTARDVGMVFLAGHGLNDNTGKYYFLPYNGDPDRLLRMGLPQTDIRDALNSLAGKAVFFVDSCHSGNALGTTMTRGVGSDINAFVSELASAENGVVVFTAATGRQVSLEDPAWGNGAFTKAVVEGISGQADFQHTGKITHKGLDYYVAERVKVLTKGRQSPVSIAPAGITDFPIAISGK